MNCRRYRLDQVANFRDLGGYACDGGVTRYGVIFRSTALNKATEEDIAKIEHLGVRTVIDLRFPSETKELPDRLGQDMDYINCSLMGTTKLEQLDVVNSSVVETKTLHRMYRLMLRNGGKEIRKALEVVADSEGSGIVPLRSRQGSHRHSGNVDLIIRGSGEGRYSGGLPM